VSSGNTKKSKKKIAEILQSNLVTIWAVISMLFAFIIHCLFSKQAPNDWMVAKWGAGDILTYASTVALGLLALWQNQKFKEENDKVQKRLEQISVDANELNIISKLAENESQYITLLNEAFDDLFDICGLENISLVMMGPFDKVKVSAALKRVNQASSRFVQIYLSGYQLRDYDSKALFDNCSKIVKTASRVLTEYLHTQKVLSSELESSVDFYLNTVAEKEIYLCMRRNTLHGILLEKIPLAEVRAIYVKPEVNTNGKNENGVD